MNRILLFTLILFSGVLAAQPVVFEGTKITEPSKEKEMVMMYKGAVWHRTNGISIMVDTEVMIAGIKVKSDGTMIFQNGSTSKLEEGDFIESDGKHFKSSE